MAFCGILWLQECQVTVILELPTDCVQQGGGLNQGSREGIPAGVTIYKKSRK